MEFDEAVARLEALVEQLEREGDERALELLQLVDAIHRPGMERIAAGETDQPLARALLAMYDLGPLDADAQAEEALDAVRPYLHSHGGEVELLRVDDGVVHVRMTGSCQGCAASAMTLRRSIEEALREGYPGFREVVADEPEAAPEPQPAALLQITNLRRPSFVDAGAFSDLPAGAARGATVDDVAVLLVNVEGEPYAFRNACPVDGLPLDGGRVSGTVLVCPWHNCAFDARSGARVDDTEGSGLEVVPVALRGDSLQVAVNVL